MILHCYTFFYPSTTGMLSKGPMILSWSGQGGWREDGEQSLGGMEKGAFGSSPISAAKGCCQWARESWGSGLNALSLSQPQLSPWWMPPSTMVSARHPLQGAAVWTCSLVFCRSLVCVPPLPPLVPWDRGRRLAGRACSETSETADPRAPA